MIAAASTTMPGGDESCNLEEQDDIEPRRDIHGEPAPVEGTLVKPDAETDNSIGCAIGQFGMEFRPVL